MADKQGINRRVKEKMPFNKMLRNSKGFTLIEILIVLVILAVIIGLAVPIYQTTVKRAYRAVASQNLSGLRQSEIRYFAQNNTYVTDTTKLDYDPASVAGTAHFTYSVAAGGAGIATSFTATAKGTDANGSTAVPNTNDTVTINEAGTVAGTF